MLNHKDLYNQIQGLPSTLTVRKCKQGQRMKSQNTKTHFRSIVNNNNIKETSRIAHQDMRTYNHKKW
jgi:hypothetical protein